MKTETFIKSIAEEEQIIQNAQKMIGVLRHQYLTSSEHLALGQKITIVTKEHKLYSFKAKSQIVIPESERFAFVNKIHLNNSTGEYSYGYYRCKKDGTESQINDYLGGHDYVKELESKETVS